MNPRTDAIINGALMAVGVLGVVDNVFVHWVLRLHRAVPGEHALAVEYLLIVGSLILFAIGVARERGARKRKT